MRVLVGNKSHDPLTEKQERKINLSRQQDSIKGAILSPDDATQAYIGSTRKLFIIVTVLTFILSMGIASLADEMDRSLVLGGAIVINVLLAAFFFFLLRHRIKVWNAVLGLRVLGLEGTGTAISLDAAELGVASQIFPWPTLGIDQVEFAAFSTRNMAAYTIERLSFATPTGRVVLDAAMMQNGRLIVDNAWRRLRPATT